MSEISKTLNFMVYNVFNLDSNALQGLPETGMGYQIVEASKYGESRFNRFVVYNSELAIDLDTEFDFYKRQVFVEGYSNKLMNSRQLILTSNSIRILNKSEFLQDSNVRLSEYNISKRRHAGGKGALDNPKENASGVEIFVRLSAYEQDKRIDFENKRLKQGSYTTTMVDYAECVTANDDPVDRYALPNDEKIKWAFFIRPFKNDTLQRGVVQPAFGHSGGGIEAYFASGTSNNSYLLHRTYGEIK
jgi:hypothetical protein